MKIGVIADDFTGASDIALTIAQAGMSVVQYINVPEADAAPDTDAGVVALKSRTAPAKEAVVHSLAACDWLLEQGATQIIFKVCSTFDSTPEGNIGPVLDALADRLRTDRVIVCPAFPENGRSVYMGHLFVEDRLLSESGMQHHPLTPMTDPDLRRVLAAQSKRPVSHVSAATVFQGAEAIAEALPMSGHTIVDAIRDADLLAIGKAAANARLLCGGSGIALGLPANFGATAQQPEWSAVSGPGVVLSGSCSQATRGQVERFLRRAAGFELPASMIMQGDVTTDRVADWVLAQESAPLVYSSADPQIVLAAQERYGRAIVAKAIEDFFSDLAAALVTRGVRRIVVAGGETSGAVVNGLKAQRLRIGPGIAPGVPLVKPEGMSLALALKSGNFGGPEFFTQALDRMEQS